jgi:hypothetical protein
LPIIRFRRAEGFRGFTGSLPLRPVELLVSLADLTGVFPSQRRLLPPSFPTGRSPFPRSDITTVATEQAPPMGLSPIGTSASIAAQAPSLHRNYPASSVLRASPPSPSARPFSHELPVDPHRDHRWDFPCCVWSPFACMPSPIPRQVAWNLFDVRFHPLRPSRKPGRSAPALVFSRPAQRSLTLRPARSPSRLATLCTRGFSSLVASTAALIATGWSEPVPGRAYPPVDQHLFTAHPVMRLTRQMVQLWQKNALRLAIQREGTGPLWIIVCCYSDAGLPMPEPEIRTIGGACSSRWLDEACPDHSLP